MPGGGTRPGEEVRDGPHNNNRCGGNRGGVAPTAASLRPRVGLGLSGSGLILLLVALVPTARRDRSLCFLGALRGIAGGETMSTSAAAGTTLRTHVSQGNPCSAHRLLSWVGASSLLGAGPSLCRFAPPRCPKPSPGRTTPERTLVYTDTTHITPDDMSTPSPASLVLSGRGYAELRHNGVLRSSVRTSPEIWPAGGCASITNGSHSVSRRRRF
jgi:hypothetical protein